MIKLLGLSGPSGSGKTTLAACLRNHLGDGEVSIHSQDAYYRDLSHLPRELREGRNFDQPTALDLDLLEDHLRDLKRGRAVEEPIYDFQEHVRRGTRRVQPGAALVIVDGHLIFSSERVLGLMDLSVYLDADLDLLLVRRLLRDTRERGRSVESVCRQYLETVRPMLFEHGTKGKARADLVLSTADGVDVVLRSALAAVSERLGIRARAARGEGAA